MRVLVVGGGIGGMAAGVALERAGIEALVLEREPELREVGAGFNLGPNAVKAMRHLGLGDLLASRGAECDGVLISSLESGEPIVFAKEEVHYQMHRPDLLGGLRQAISEERVRLGARVDGFHQDSEGISVSLESGEVIEGDLLIGADGIHSTIRESVIGPQEPRFTGCIAWRAVIPAERMPQHAVSRNWGWAGPGRSAFFYPIRSYELLNFVANVPADEVQRESWSLSGDVADLRRSMAGSCDTVLEIVDAIEEAFLTGIYFHDPLTSWANGRVTLLGDAAHAAGPFLGQGGAMALEDAITLADCLRRAQPDDGPTALKEYERRRRPRTTRFQIAVRAQQQFLHEADRERARARNLRARGAQRLDPLWGGGVGFLIGFDPVAALDQTVEELEQQSGASINVLKRPQARRAFELWSGALTPEDQAGDWVGERTGYGRFLGKVTPPAPDHEITSLQLDDVAALQVTPAASTDSGPIIFHLHGGSYIMGSAASAAGLAGRLAETLGGVAVVPDYRLAPEHGAPAALQDAIRSYREIASREPKRAILVTGDDAGGGLAVALAVAVRELDVRRPAGIYAISPFCDLSLRSPSVAHARSDPWLTHDALVVFAGSYIQTMDPDEPTISPLYADLSNLPPILIHAAADEALADDARRLAAVAKEAQTETSLRLFEDTVHDFPLFDFLPETKEALSELRSFWTSINPSPVLAEKEAR